LHNTLAIANVLPVADLLAAVAEPSRRRLLQLLAGGEQSVNDLAAHFTVTRSAISQHLAILVEAGLVTRRRDGRFQHYSIVSAGLAALRAELDAFWTGELDQLVFDALEMPTLPRLERQH
jgi:DNA-binding transcriptional ArsR family regulator